MASCFVCETPFQLLSAMNYTYNSTEKIDAYIYDKIKNVDRIKNELISSGVFRNIYIYTYSKKGIIFKYLYKYGYIITPKFYLKKTTSELVSCKRYNTIYLSTLTKFGMAIAMTCKKCNVVYFDDGLGSYVGKIGFNYISKNRKLAYYLTFKNYKHLFPKEIYLYNPNISNSKWNVEIKKLPDLHNMDEYFKETLYRVFGELPKHIYNKSRFVFLSQPCNEIGQGLFEGKDIVYNELSGLNIVVRPHPLDKTSECTIENVDKSGCLWELVCADLINDESVLIAKCSTAQYVPKMLFNKEPFLIFTYDLYDYISDSLKSTYKELFNTIRLQYSDSTKVINVSTIEQLESVIKRFRNGL